MRCRNLFVLLVPLVIVCGCGKKAENAHAKDDAVFPASAASKLAPIPPANAFVISKSEFATIQAFLDKHYPSSRRSNPSGVAMLGYPKGSTLPDFLNGKNSSPSFRYTDLNTLQLMLGTDALLELRPEDITKIREWITKYREWKQTSESQHLAERVPKSLGKVGYTEFVFITPDVLRIGEARLEEKDVNGLWKQLTTDLPILRAFAMDRVKTASRMIDAEDPRRASIESQAKRDRAAADAALK